MNGQSPADVELVIGVDTHKHTHTAAVIEASTGSQRDVLEVGNDAKDFATLLEGVADRPRVWAIEGAGGDGSGLARWLVAHGELVTEVERPRRPARRHGAKSDPIDALRAAREALATPHSATPKQGGIRAALAARLTARRSAIQAAGTAQRQLHALVVTCPASLHQRLAKLGTRQLIDRCQRLRVHASHDGETAETHPGAAPTRPPHPRPRDPKPASTRPRYLA